jgi:hypothetical protein
MPVDGRIRVTERLRLGLGPFIRSEEANSGTRLITWPSGIGPSIFLRNRNNSFAGK